MKILKAGALAATLIGLGLSCGQSALASDPRLCAFDRPCFNAAYQSGNKVIFEFNGVSGWDFYNVRYRVKGGGAKQVENRSGRFTINNVLPNRRYTITVQGCRSRFLARSICSPWVQESVETR
jgi:hypothetical protein